MKTLLLGLARPFAWLGYELWPRRRIEAPPERPATVRPAEPSPDAQLRRDVERMREELETLVFTTKILCGLVLAMVLALVVVALKTD